MKKKTMDICGDIFFAACGFSAASGSQCPGNQSGFCEGGDTGKEKVFPAQ